MKRHQSHPLIDMLSSFSTQSGFRALLAILSILASAGVAGAAPADSMFKFDFGTSRTMAGATTVAPDTIYTSQRSFGFEADALVETSKNGEFLTSSQPFLFSIALPEGNYRVTLRLGDRQGESNTTVKAESRRLMLHDVNTARGEIVTRTFTVHVRNASLKSGQNVRLKEREKGVLHWDEKLTLEFNGARPCIDTLEIAPAPDARTIYIAGDSTVTDQPQEPWAGWGQMLPYFFDENVAVANYAESGETLRAFIGEKRLEKILDTLQSGDYLLIQFGHNDMKERGEGIGAFTSYSDSLRQFVAAAKQRGATPALVTPMERRRFNADGKVEMTLGDYPEAVRRVAKDEAVPLIDLNAMSVQFYQALGADNSKKAFVHYAANTFPGQTTALKDDTHFNPYGAFQLAKAVVEGIKTGAPELAKHLRDGAATYNPAQPDAVENWNYPASPVFASQKPDGN